MAAFTAIVALIGAVIVAAAIISSLTERLRVPQVALFLVLGAALGPFGLGLVNFTLTSAALGAVATLGLILVLFTDAVSLDIAGLRRHLSLALTVLGPGSLITAVIVGAAGYWLFGLHPAEAAILGAALASTDPVMMRGLLQHGDVPVSARYALRVESGLNDAVLLPIVLIAMGFLHTPEHATPLGRVIVNIFVLGPLAGLLVGFIAVTAMEKTRRRFGMRRDYESMYVLGVAFTAYAAGEAVHGSGFMAAFTAGMAIAILDVELCDCFHDYGAATSEMCLLFAFVAFGTSLIWSGLTIINVRTLAFAAVALLARSAVLLVALRWQRLKPADRRIIVWFGPRGLSSLLLILLPVFAGIDGAERLFAPCALVVLLSVVGHGAMQAAWIKSDATPVDITPVATTPPVAIAPRSMHPAGTTVPSETHASPTPTATAETALVSSPEYVTIDEVNALWAAREPVVIVDGRSETSYDASDRTAAGAVRLEPDRSVAQANARKLPRDAWLIVYCA